MFDVFLLTFPAILLIFLLLLGVPVAFSMLIAGVTGLALILGPGPSEGILSGVLYSQVSGFTLTTIPLFILMAMFLRESGLTKDIFAALQTWVGHFRGGLAIATTITNGILAALTGSSTAAVAALSTIAIPEMRKYGYDDRMSIGTVAAAGTIASMIPPSLGLIIYGILTQNNIGDLFIAGVIPGVLTLIGYIFLIQIWARREDVAGDPVPRATWAERSESLSSVWAAVILMTVVLGGIYTGIMTASEAGGVGAVGALIILLYRKHSSQEPIGKACKSAIELTTMIFFILIGAFIFSIYMGATGFTDLLLGSIVSLPFPPFIVLLLVVVAYIGLGTVMDQLAVLVLTLPITYPLAVDTFGYHPIWFGVIIVKTIEIGLITPPLGLNVFVATSTIDVEVSTAFRGAGWFLIVDGLVILLLFAFPNIALVLL